MVTVIWPEAMSLKKEDAIALLKERNIDTRPFFYPLSMMPAYAHFPSARRAQKMNKISYDIHWRSINLPCAMNITRDDIKKVVSSLNEIFESNFKQKLDIKEQYSRL